MTSTDWTGKLGRMDSFGASQKRYSVAAREKAAKKGTALPSGKFPIRNRRELDAAIRRRHQSDLPAKMINAHIRKRAKALGVPVTVRLSSGQVIECAVDRTKAEQAARRRSPMSVGGKRDPSLRWPWLYDILRSKGYDKEKAAAISNAQRTFRKKGRLNVLNYKQADKMRTVRAAVKKAGY